MGEKIPSPGEQIANLLRVIIGIITILILAYFFLSTRAILETKSLIRENTEIMENIFSSKIAAERAVLDAKELDKLRNSDAESFARHCSVGYFMSVKTKDDQWSFGYKPKIFTSSPSVTQEYPAAVLKNSVIIPAKVSLTVYDSTTTRISCAIEKSYALGDIQTAGTPCTATHVSRFSVKKKQQGSQQFVCVNRVSATSLLFSSKPAELPEESECRYLPDAVFDDFSYECKEDSKLVIKTYPVKTGNNCEELRKTPALIAKKGEVQKVVLCVEQSIE